MVHCLRSTEFSGEAGERGGGGGRTSRSATCIKWTPQRVNPESATEATKVILAALDMSPPSSTALPFLLYYQSLPNECKKECNNPFVEGVGSRRSLDRSSWRSLTSVGESLSVPPTRAFHPHPPLLLSLSHRAVPLDKRRSRRPVDLPTAQRANRSERRPARCSAAYPRPRPGPPTLAGSSPPSDPRSQP